MMMNGYNQQVPNMFDTYRLKLFRELLDKRYESILVGEDKRQFEHNDRLYRMGFWAMLASVPINIYYGF